VTASDTLSENPPTLITPIVVVAVLPGLIVSPLSVVVSQMPTYYLESWYDDSKCEVQVPMGMARPRRLVLGL